MMSIWVASVNLLSISNVCVPQQPIVDMVHDEIANATSSILAQLEDKAPKANPVFTGTVSADAISANGLASLMGGSAISVMNAQDGGTGRGLYMWNEGDTNWAIYMSTAGAGKSFTGGTAVSGHNFNLHSIRFRVHDGTMFGFIWETSSDDRMMSLQSNTGNCWIKGTLDANGITLASDDRLKFNEQVLTDGLAVVRQLSPQVYHKSSKMNVQKDLRLEVGLIAQEVELISQLAHTVTSESVTTAPVDGADPSVSASGSLSLDYVQIFVYALQAIKELDSQMTTMQTQMTTMQAQMTAMQARLDAAGL